MRTALRCAVIILRNSVLKRRFWWRQCQGVHDIHSDQTEGGRTTFQLFYLMTWRTKHVNIGFGCMFLTFKVTTFVCYMFFLILNSFSFCVVLCVISQIVGVRLFGIIHLPHGVICQFVVLSLSGSANGENRVECCFSSLYHILQFCVFADIYPQLLIDCPLKAAMSLMVVCVKCCESLHVGASLSAGGILASLNSLQKVFITFWSCSSSHWTASIWLSGRCCRLSSCRPFLLSSGLLGFPDFFTVCGTVFFGYATSAISSRMSCIPAHLAGQFWIVFRLLFVCIRFRFDRILF